MCVSSRYHWFHCRPGELEHLTHEVINQLRKQAITGSSRKDRLFLGVDVSRLGYVNKGHLREMCMNHHLPCDDDIVDAVCHSLSLFQSLSG